MFSYKKAVFIFTPLIAAFTAIKSPQASEIKQESITFTTAIPVEIVEDGKFKETIVRIEQKIEPCDHLAETNYIRDEILNSLERRTESLNARVFYPAKESFLRSKEKDVMANPDSINEVKAHVKSAQDWYALSKNLSPNDFKIAFATSGLEVAQQSRQR